MPNQPAHVSLSALQRTTTDAGRDQTPGTRPSRNSTTRPPLRSASGSRLPRRSIYSVAASALVKRGGLSVVGSAQSTDDVTPDQPCRCGELTDRMELTQHSDRSPQTRRRDGLLGRGHVLTVPRGAEPPESLLPICVLLSTYFPYAFFSKR